ncbi:spore germination protein GerKC [Gracilibacillus boraciitolerans JCM 21714]|uniref:Spore germination protein GerKC n=1 Tax=Gracilibacillus boraciitolerans JCM 21714 TaxID=1298598 RepID=W4VGR9_9BACI|nr:Ger(x)C family spore germination protein [Gracilibacillus boraciitolerans]GAE92402.1 spore germination protein GerKC [Gracilibacillus boraciitolerans JCM 21714]
MKHYRILLVFGLVIFLSGCWDETPIDDRSFVIGSALDKAEEGIGETNRITLTNQFVIPSKISNPGQMSGGSSEQKAYENLSVTGQSAFQISREMLSLTNRIPNYEHLQILIVSPEIARDPDYFSSVLDSFIRDHEIRREIKVIISDGDASELLNVRTETEDIPARFIDTILENNIKSLELIDPVTIGLVHQYLLDDNSYLIPSISLMEGNINYDGVAVFDGKSDQQVGTLKGEDIQGYKLIEGKIKNGALTFYIDNKLMIYEISDAKSTININTANPEDIKISIAIDTEGPSPKCTEVNHFWINPILMILRKV